MGAGILFFSVFLLKFEKTLTVIDDQTSTALKNSIEQ